MSARNPKELLKFRASPVLRRAIKLRAALLDVDLQDVVVAILTKELGAEIAEVEKRGLLGNQATESQDKPVGQPKKSKKQ